jgi:hypothetical protein
MVASTPSAVGERSSRPKTTTGVRSTGSASILHSKLSAADSRAGVVV